MMKRATMPALQRGLSSSSMRAIGCATIDLPSQPLVRAFHQTPSQCQQVQQEPSTTQQQQSMIAHHLHHNNPHLLGSLSVRHPATPFVLGWGEVESELDDPVHTMMSTSPEDDEESVEEESAANEEDEGLGLKGRNTRKVKKANHGARPNNRLGRRAKRRRYGNPRRQ